MTPYHRLVMVTVIAGQAHCWQQLLWQDPVWLEALAAVRSPGMILESPSSAGFTVLVCDQKGPSCSVAGGTEGSYTELCWGMWLLPSPQIIATICFSSWLMFTLLEDQLLSRGPLTVAHYSVFVSFYFVWAQRERDLQHKPHSWQEKGEHLFKVLVLSPHFPLCGVLGSVASYRLVGALAGSSQIRGKV